MVFLYILSSAFNDIAAIKMTKVEGDLMIKFLFGCLAIVLGLLSVAVFLRFVLWILKK